MPDLTACLPRPPEVQSDEIILVSTYYDTVGVDLLGQRITQVTRASRLVP